MRKLLTAFALLIISFASKSQNVGIGTSNPNPSAMLEISSNNSGFLPPRMTSMERDSIQQPASGLMIYNTTTDCLQIFSKGRWQNMFCGTNDTTIVTDSTIVTDIDGNTYPTVKICNQTWMAKNLSVARYRNGDPIPQVTDPAQWANLTTGAWCWYNNDSATYGATYGRLYNWYAVNDPRGLAPAGWHVPSDGEWNKFIKCVDTNADTTGVFLQTSTGGGYLKEIGNIHWSAPNIGATDSYNFKALPSGMREIDGVFSAMKYLGLWWTTTEYDQNNSYKRGVGFNDAGFGRDYFNKKWGFSVRCIKDTPGTSLNNGLVAYYPFNGNANDESGNGNHGTVNGASLTTDRFGSSGKAYSFDGLNDYISTTDLDLFDSFTISVWVFPIGTLGALVDKSEDNISNSGYVFIYNNSTYGLYGHVGWSGNTNNNIIPSNNYISNNQWHSCVLTFKQGSAKIYVDGSQTYSRSGLNSTSLNNDLLLFGKSVWGGNLFNGKLDDIRIYNRALTQEEITYLATH
jgi:uncharacterized protein (TIGR02145 family)